MWQLHDHVAHLKIAHFSASVDITRPGSGVKLVGSEGMHIEVSSLLGIQLQGDPTLQTESEIENYIRGNDLIANYKEDSQRPYESSIYWRSISYAAVEGIEILVSFYTQQAEIEPSVNTITRLPAMEVLRTIADNEKICYEPVTLTSNQECQIRSGQGEGLFLFRFADSDFSYAEMIHPSDFQRALLKKDQSARQVQLSFLHFAGQCLEKGVIRRGRVLGVFVPRKDDRQIATQCYRRLISEVPPLAT